MIVPLWMGLPTLASWRPQMFRSRRESVKLPTHPHRAREQGRGARPLFSRAGLAKGPRLLAEGRRDLLGRAEGPPPASWRHMARSAAAPAGRGRSPGSGSGSKEASGNSRGRVTLWGLRVASARSASHCNDTAMGLLGEVVEQPSNASGSPLGAE